MADASPSRYVRVLHGSLGHPKFIGLTALERGTWLVCLQLADIAHPDPVHEQAVRMHVPDASFERLYARRLIEAVVPSGERDGWFRIHDLKQFHVAPSSTPEAVAERKRRSRAKKKKVTPVTKVTSVTDVTIDETIRDDTRRLDVLKGSQGESRARVDGPGRPIEAVT